MKRRVIGLAKNTLVVSLPSNWTKKFKISKGGEVNVQEIDGKLILAPVSKNLEEKRISIQAKGLDKKSFAWLLIALHKSGYDEIEIFHDKENKEVPNNLIKEMFTGFAITYQTDSITVLKCLAHELDKEFLSIFNRNFLVALQLADQTLNALTSKNLNPASLELEKINNKLTQFCQRILIKQNQDKACFYYLTLWNLEKICNLYRDICNYFLKNKETKTSKEELEFFSKVNSYLRFYYDLFTNFKLEKMKTFVEEKEKIEEFSKRFNSDLSIFLKKILSKIYELGPTTMAIKLN